MLIVATDLLGKTAWATGWVAVAGASFVFGSTGVPMKDPILSTLDETSQFGVERALIFAAYTSLGIFVVNLPVLIYLIENDSFIFMPWALLGSIDIVIINIWAFLAVQAFGYTKAPAIWCSVGMITSFLLGALAFQETVHNVVFGSLSIPTLIAGVVLVLSASSPTAAKSVSTQDISYRKVHRSDPSVNTLLDLHRTDIVNDAEEETVETTMPFHCNKEACRATAAKDTNKGMSFEIDCKDVTRSVVGNSISRSSPALPTLSNCSPEWSKHFLSLMYCVCTGIFDGALMVPFKLSHCHTLPDTFAYLATFGVGSVVMTIVVLSALYILQASDVKRGALLSLYRQALVPALCSGSLWAAANFLSIHATKTLGLWIGFPLTQTCVVFAALWGILFFREVDVSQGRVLVCLATGVGLVLVGSVFLALSS